MSHSSLSAAERVALARNSARPGIADYIDALFTDFFPQRGDRLCGEDASILGGIALFHGRPVTVIGTRKGKNLEENLTYNFGMPSPEGYRKALRLMRQAEKFGRPVLTFIDTPGAYPGVEAEARGQGEAIARNLAAMSGLTVPLVAVITGEGNSGGALALAVADTVLMLEHAVYSILSPEGFASILWRDASRSGEACELMKLTSRDLLELGVIDGIIPEPSGGAHTDPEAVFCRLDRALSEQLELLQKSSGAQLTAVRYRKFRRMGNTQKERTCAKYGAAPFPHAPSTSIWSPCGANSNRPGSSKPSMASVTAFSLLNRGTRRRRFAPSESHDHDQVSMQACIWARMQSSAALKACSWVMAFSVRWRQSRMS